MPHHLRRIVPLRNWNPMNKGDLGTVALSYRTFEELKLLLDFALPCSALGRIVPLRNWNKEVVVINGKERMGRIVPLRNWNCLLYVLQVTYLSRIVPLRNWNARDHKYLRFQVLVVSYLWGIETCSRQAFFDFYCFCRIVPLRNWNSPVPSGYQWPFNCRIVPLRNWNLLSFTDSKRMSSSVVSYLWGIETLRLPIQIEWLVLKSYCTFEELKQFVASF